MDKQVFILATPRVRQNAAQAVLAAGDGFRVEIKPRARTLDQNALLWSCLSDLATQIEWPVNGRLEKLSAEDWKDMLSASLHQEARLAQGIRGGVVMLGKRTSKMTVAQMTELIDLIHAFGDERGVEWSETSLGR